MLNVIHLILCTAEMLVVCLNSIILINTCDIVYCLQNLRSGTTTVVGMVTDLHLHMGWMGDSQIILVRRGVPAFASQPHKPEREVNVI